MREPEREVEAVVEGYRDGAEWMPSRIRHRSRPLSWRVQEVTHAWVRPSGAGRAGSGSGVVRRYRLHVYGPLPGEPSEQGPFVLLLTAYRDRPGWWITPDTPVRPPAAAAVHALGPAGRAPGVREAGR